MKRYVNYLDGIEAPEDLEEKLRTLKPARRAVPMYRWAAAAAALAVVLGAGAVWRHVRKAPSLSDKAETAVTDAETGSRTEVQGTGPATEPDITYEDGGETGSSPAGGGYDLTDGSQVAYYFLPALNFEHAEMMASPDYALGDTWRDAESEEIEAILTPLWREHLGIPEETDTETFTIYEKNGSVNGFQLTVSWEGNSIDMEQQIGYNVPTCCVSPDDAYGHTDVNGVDVVTLTWCGDGPDGADDHCEVKFLVNGTGWKATIAGENYRELASRFVSLGITPTAGLASAFPESDAPGDTPVTPDGVVVPEPVEGPVSVEGPEAWTPPYDPNAQ